MAFVEALPSLPSCFDYFSKENKKIYITPLYNSQNQECQCRCPLENIGTWGDISSNATAMLFNTVLAVLGMLFICAFTRQALIKTVTRKSDEQWREDICCRPLKGKIRKMLELLETKDCQFRGAAVKLKSAEKTVRKMKLSANQVHATILCQMVKLREALDWIENHSRKQAENETNSLTTSTCSSKNIDAIDAKIAMLESQIYQHYKDSQSKPKQTDTRAKTRPKTKCAQQKTL
ncbi:hypothetical protein WDU94_007813 [Cyamophila willieti]